MRTGVGNKLLLVIALACLQPNQLWAQNSCEESDTQLFQKLLGTWHEYRLSDEALAAFETTLVEDEDLVGDEASSTESGTLIGTLNTELVAQGCALRQSFSSPDRSFSFESLAYLDPTGNWQETYAMSNGVVSQYRWVENEEELILEQIGVTGAARKRLVIFNMTETDYFVLDERSTDRGQTWNRFELVKTVRVVEQAPAE
ncbi:MAG: hypothetical protein AAF431_12710 [Pseudomonadota bacterium]